MKSFRFNKFISLLLCALMILTFLPSNASAAEGDYHTVTFYGWENKKLDEQQVLEGQDAKPPADIPTPEGNQFVGWSGKYTVVMKNEDIYAQFKAKHTVTFLGGESLTDVLKTEVVLDGGFATAPDDKAVPVGKEFVGWDVNFNLVTSDLNVTAQYATPKPKPQYFSVSFVVNKVTIDTQLVEENGFAIKPTDPPKTPEDSSFEGMSFLFWSAKDDEQYDFSTPVTEDLVLSANFGTVAMDAPSKESVAFGTILPIETYLKTYIFTVNDSQWGETQIVATGDTLYEPTTPTAAAGMRFVGWFDSGNTQFTSFGTQAVEETAVVTLHAVFVTAYYAFFYNAAGTAILETREPDASNQVSTTNVTALQVAADEAVTGWSYTLGGSAVGDTIIVSGGNKILYPIIEKVKWISFNSNGGTYVSPMHVAPNTMLTSNMVAEHVDLQVEGTVITRGGYTFEKWNGFTFGQVVTSNITLNATWTANTNTPYKLVYWIENADDANYSFEKTVAKTGTSGAAITLSTAELSINNLNSSYKTYFNTGTYTSGTTINGDGSSIVNIYHTRKTFTLTFVNGSNNVYSETFKYDQDISAVWAVAAIKNLLDTGYVWKSSLTQYYYSFLQKMPGSNVTMTATKWSGYLHMWYYYLETLDGTAATAPAGSETTTNGGITYYKSRTVRISGSANLVLTYNEDYYPITGFSQRDGTVPSFTLHDEVGHWETIKNKQKWVVDQEAYYDASLYYRRSSYSLTFINGDMTNTISNIKFEASIQNQNYTPTRPTGVPTNFAFMGWFTTEGGFAGSEFTWAGKTMPNKNLILYAKWAPPTFTSIAHLMAYGEGGGTYDLGTVPYGGTISTSALNEARAEAEDYKHNTTDTFGGWMIDINGSRMVFNASMQIFENVSLYPLWISGVSYHVTYNLNGAVGTVPSDAFAYGVGAKAVVLDIASTVVAPTGKVFTGWRVGTTGPVYYPGSAVTISGDTTLYAVWSNTASLVTITYDGNGNNTPAASSTHTVPVVNNTIHYVLGGDLFTYTGKEFVEWNTLANGFGTGYDPNDPALISASQPSSPTTLYAIWRTASFSVTLTGGSWTYNGGAHSATLTGTQSSDTIEYRTSTNGGTTWSTWSSTKPSVTHVSDGPMQVQVKVSRANYNDATASATLTITKQAIELTADSGSWTYDASEHTKPSYTITDGSFATGEGLTSATFAATSAITNAGSVANTITGVTPKDGTQENDYAFTYKAGTLTITNATFSVTLTGGSWTYNGGAHSATLTGTQSSDTIEYRTSTNGGTTWSTWSSTKPSVTHVSDGPMQVQVKVSRANYNDATASATLTITKQAIELTADSGSWTYDASEHTKPSYTITDGSFATGEGLTSATFAATSAITNAGSVANTITGVTPKDGTQENDYAFTYKAGTLTITPRAVMIVMDPSEKNYGDADPAFTYSLKKGAGYYDVIADTGITIMASRIDLLAPTGQDAGVHSLMMTAKYVAENATAQANYTFSVENADFTINPQVVYDANTTDVVTGMPAMQWFAYNGPATLSGGAGVARVGYILSGWQQGTTVYTLGETIPAITENMTLLAVWVPAPYSVNYLTGAVGVTNMPANVPSVLNTATYNISIVVPTRVGYTFTGWSTSDVTGLSETYVAGSGFTMPANDVTLTATWSAPIIYPITYVMNGGVNVAANPANYTYESATINLAAPTRAGYAFLGWTPAGIIPTGSIGARAFTANWSAPLVYPINYVMNGGINAAANPATYTVVSGLITLVDPTRVGYDFLGWTPTDNIPAASTGGRTFTATWSQPHIHTVTYFVSGGTQAGLDGTTPYAVYRNVAYGAVVPVPNNPAQSEFAFNGWTSTIPVTMPDEDVVLYGTMTRMPALKEIIPEQQTPLAGPTWALLNLILAIVTALAIISIFMLLKKRREVELTKRSKAFRWLTLVPAIGAILAFLLTEDMSNPMVFTDQWTILMIGIAAVQVLVAVFGIQKKRDAK